MGYAIALAQPCLKGFTHPTVESAQLLSIEIWPVYAKRPTGGSIQLRLDRGCIRLVKEGFQNVVGTANLVNDALAPVAILPPPFEGPIGGGGDRHISDIGNFVSEFHQFGAIADVGDMLHLQLFTGRLRQRFIVRQFLDNGRHRFAKQVSDFSEGGFGIFDGIVQERPDENDRVVDVGLIGQNVEQFDGVINVGRMVRIFTPLLAMLTG